ncbi:signal transduction histidine kinase regulating citrate/malate metabolism [Oceaniovalibus guishaninsula JLT2003]|uniref:Signal transduction histidine kinase regulating citrate/malate metabolism n=1 Tax=Oceaniovalibus guishaninsula JLT2003 TaxID=1231392 RepID=K2I6X5_9RHOB|nr:DUF6446 family protein [Oceaniovalibus guishaninsula]EKE44750.1 signal transduction histidine kinase regulating citrate/malate metabolism [Oceaniovalibus guishaninsula JLT2003]
MRPDRRGGILGKVIVGAIVLIALVGGAALYYLQVYAFYDEVPLQDGDIRLTGIVSGQPEPILAQNVAAIDADSSPLRFRACFDTPMSLAMLTETFVVADDPVPLLAPGWFGCFDAGAIGADLDSGRAVAFLSEKNVHYGVDRIVAVTEDGRGYVWHQLNDCGALAYDGTPVGEACPPRPEED